MLNLKMSAKHYHKSEPDRLFQRADQQQEAGNLRSAFRLYLAAAKAGDTGCQNNLGNFYSSGIGVKPNRAKALYWYRRAYRQGERCAASNIGVVFRDEQKWRHALAWFERAVELGDGDANLQIAKIYMNPENDRAMAIRYLKKTVRAKYVTQASTEEAARLLKRLSRAKKV